MEREEQRRIAEALILGSPEPVSAQLLLSTMRCQAPTS